MHSII